MKPLIEVINTDNEINLIEYIMSKPKQIEAEEWLYKGCFIQKFVHQKIFGKYSVFKNDKNQTFIKTVNTFLEAKKLCEINENFDNYLTF